MQIDLDRKLMHDVVEQLAATRGCSRDPAMWDKSPLGQLYSMLVQYLGTRYIADISEKKEVHRTNKSISRNKLRRR